MSSPSEKWRTRTGESVTKELSQKPHAVAQREWALQNPDKILAYSKKAHKRQSLKRAKARINWKLSGARMAMRNKPGKLDAEILRHHAKGRSIADIVVWMNIPASVVSAAIQNASK